MEAKTLSQVFVPIRYDTDVVIACQKGRILAAQVEFSDKDQAVVVIAISEIAQNIFRYAGHGEIVLTAIRENDRQGITIDARDEGPGIPDIARALQDGYSTGQGLGLGLSGAKRLMDEFDIESGEDQGTQIVMKKWRPRS